MSRSFPTTMPKKLATLLVGLFTASLFCSCASEAVKEQARKEREAKKANKGDYVDYYPVGSNIPIKVPKDDPRVAHDDLTTETAQDAMREAQSSGKHQVKSD